MWAIINRTPYAAERNWLRDKDGAHHWCVAVRATFDIGRAGKLVLKDEQTPPLLAPEYFGKPGISSLRYDSDLLNAKPATDILLLAHAYAPRGRPTPTVPVSLRIGGLEKHLLVHGDRFYEKSWRGVAMTESKPFNKSPIQYERAFGGSDFANPDPKRHRIDERNPVGVGFAVDPATLIDQPAHTVEYPRREAAEAGPAGFGPIDSSWLPRRKLAGTYDARWEQTKKPLLPDDFDPAFALCAPADQRSSRPISGGEHLEIINMTPEGSLRIEIPRIALTFTTRIAGRTEQHMGRVIAVLIEPDERRLALVWQSLLRVRALEADYLDSTQISELR